MQTEATNQLNIYQASSGDLPVGFYVSAGLSAPLDESVPAMARMLVGAARSAGFLPSEAWRCSITVETNDDVWHVKFEDEKLSEWQANKTNVPAIEKMLNVPQVLIDDLLTDVCHVGGESVSHLRLLASNEANRTADQIVDEVDSNTVYLEGNLANEICDPNDARQDARLIGAMVSLSRRWYFRDSKEESEEAARAYRRCSDDVNDLIQLIGLDPSRYGFK